MDMLRERIRYTHEWACFSQGELPLHFFDTRSCYIAQAGLLTLGATCLSLSILGKTVPALDVILSPAHMRY